MAMQTLPESLLRDIRRYGYELGAQGLFVPCANVIVGGKFDYELRHGGIEEDAEFWSSQSLFVDQGLKHMREADAEFWSSPNLFVDQGLNHMLDVVFHGATAVSPWYIGLFEGNYTPVAGDTAATFPASATECTAYDEATRREYVEAAAASKSITNSANRAEFTFNATKTIYGGFLASISTKGGTTGTLAAADRGTTSKSVVDDDVLLVGYTLSLTST